MQSSGRGKGSEKGKPREHKAEKSRSSRQKKSSHEPRSFDVEDPQQEYALESAASSSYDDHAWDPEEYTYVSAYPPSNAPDNTTQYYSLANTSWEQGDQETSDNENQQEASHSPGVHYHEYHFSQYAGHHDLSTDADPLSSTYQSWATSSGIQNIDLVTQQLSQMTTADFQKQDSMPDLTSLSHEDDSYRNAPISHEPQAQASDYHRDVQIRKFNGKDWGTVRGFIDTGNYTGQMIYVETVFRLGYTKEHIDDDMIEFETLGDGEMKTFGKISLQYSIGGEPAQNGSFHVLRKTLREIDVWFAENNNVDASFPETKRSMAGISEPKRRLREGEYDFAKASWRKCRLI